MLPTTVEALVIIALVLSPGYVFTQVARRVIPHVQEPTDFRFLLMVITVGTAIQGLMFPWTSHILDYYIAHTLPEHRLDVVLWAVAVVLIVPLVLGVAVGRLTFNRWVEAALDFVGLGYVDRMPSAWDFVLRKLPGRPQTHGDAGVVIFGASMSSRIPH